MTVIGFHCSHEQINPAQLLRDVQQAEQAGFTAGMSSDHFSPWSARQGESGFAWSFLGAALATTTLPFGVVNAPGQRYHPAIIAPGHRDTCADVPWPLLGGARIGRGLQRAQSPVSVWPRKEVRDQRARRVRRRHPAPSSRRGGQPRRPRPRQPGAAVDAARHRPRPRRPGRHARRPRARHAAWADGLITVNQPQGNAAEGPRLLPRRRRPRSGPPADPPQLGAHGGGGHRHRARPVAQQRLRSAGVLGPRDGRGLRRHR